MNILITISITLVMILIGSHKKDINKIQKNLKEYDSKK